MGGIVRMGSTTIGAGGGTRGAEGSGISGLSSYMPTAIAKAMARISSTYPGHCGFWDGVGSFKRSSKYS